MLSTIELRPIIYLVFLGSSWGLYFSMLKVAALSGISYIGIITLTTLGVGAGMITIALLRRRKPEFSARHHLFYLVCALTGYLLPMIAELLVIAHMPASVLTLIVSISPLATLLIAWIMKTDTINMPRVVGVLVGAVAIFAILLPDTHINEAVAWYWLLLATTVPISYAIHHNFTARCWPSGSDSYQVACGEAIYASVLMVAFSMFHWQWQDVQSWNQGHSAILFMATIALIDIYIYFELIRLKGPIYTSHANYFMVISGVMWGMLIFAERPSPLMWISALLLVTSLYLIGERKTREENGRA
ncbi:MAG: DMT family transporter [Gammaproteobacteria bacterium]|nr:DMT family transporter [Gammaproteobacteria bacterium]MDH3858677.1 DMT family transporter [Gammaproteobacteria bacterium]